MFSGTLLRRE